MVVADHGDSAWDSSIFMEARSFKLDANLGGSRLQSEGNAVCDQVYELNSSIDANEYKWFKDGVEIPGETSKT